MDRPKVPITNISEWSQTLHSSHRPYLIHLNGDTSWLIQLPYPASFPPPPDRTHFNILLDPWFTGPQSDVAWWFSSQWHVIPSSVATISELDDALREVEGRGGNGYKREGSLIDAVAISHEFTDHCHKATLEQLDPSTTIFASDLAAKLIRTWNHFDKVFELPEAGEKVEWRRLTVGTLPPWVALARVVTPGNALYYHAAVLIAFNINEKPFYGEKYKRGSGPPGESILYSPHGIKPLDVNTIYRRNLFTLALLHGMHDVRLWPIKQLNLGGLNGIEASRMSQAEYWIGTHDEEKTGKGLIAPFLLRKKYTYKEAELNEEKKMSKVPRQRYSELGSGEGYLLE